MSASACMCVGNQPVFELITIKRGQHAKTLQKRVAYSMMLISRELNRGVYQRYVLDLKAESRFDPLTLY